MSAILVSHTAGAQPVRPLKPAVPLIKMRADLVISDIKITPDQPRAKQDMINFDVTVKNAGNGPTRKACSLGMHLSNQDTKPDYSRQIIPWYTNNIPPLEPGKEVKIKSKTITILYPGRYKLGMVIITEGLQIGDENPQNNQKDIYFRATVPDITDLVLDSVALDPEGRIVLRMHNDNNPIPDQDFDISYVKIKVLDTGVEKNIKLKDMDPAGILKRGNPTPSLFGSGKTYLNFTWPNTGYDAIKLEPGTACIVEVTVDYNAQIRDQKRANNKKTVTLTYNPQ